MNPRKTTRRISGPAAALAAALLLLSGGCLHRADVPAADPVVALPRTFTGQAAREAARTRWWRSFGSAELDRLVEEALGANLTLREAWARLRQARARAVAAGADRFPTLAATAGAAHSRRRSTESLPVDRAADEYSLGLTSSYELDLWGRIRSGADAARLSASASREDLAAAAISVAAAVTRRWVEIVAQRMKRTLIQKQLRTNETLLALVALRFEKSMTSALDVLQQRQVVERSRAALPLVDRTEGLLVNELAVLLGNTPQQAPVIETATVDVPGQSPAAGLPIQLLTQRPDIRAAALRLQAADRRVASARADRLPNLLLTATGLYRAGETAVLLDNWLLSLAADMTAPIFDGQRRSAAVDLAAAEAEETLAAFRRTVLVAVREVEDALVREQSLRKHLAALVAERKAARKTLDEARVRYQSGLEDYLPVLTALLSVQGLDQDLIDRRTELILARIDLYGALGGRWTEDMLQTPGADVLKSP